MKLIRVKSIYVIENKEINRCKVGYAEEVKNRYNAIMNQSGCKMDLIYSSPPIVNFKQIESNIHKRFKYCRYIGEWFNTNPESILKYIESIKDKFIIDEILTEYYTNRNISNVAKKFNVSRQAIMKRLGKSIDEADVKLNNIEETKREEIINNTPINISNYKRIGKNKYLDKDGNKLIIEYKNGGWCKSVN